MSVIDLEGERRAEAANPTIHWRSPVTGRMYRTTVADFRKMQEAYRLCPRVVDDPRDLWTDAINDLRDLRAEIDRVARLDQAVTRC